VPLGYPPDAYLEKAEVRIAQVEQLLFVVKRGICLNELCARSSAGESNGFLIQA
jgi:hypothetical protein